MTFHGNAATLERQLVDRPIARARQRGSEKGAANGSGSDFDYE